jgi:hypothetical protein
MAYPLRSNPQVIIDGVDITESITISARLRNPEKHPEAWQEIIYKDDGEKIFGGYILKSKDQEGTDLSQENNINGSDYSARLERIRVKAEYFGKTDKEIIADVFSSFVPTAEGYDYSTYVNAVKTHEKIRFNRVTVNDVLKQLCSLANADFYIDEEKRVRYFLTEISSAPFGVSDTPDLIHTIPYSNFSVNRDGTGIINRLEMIGGNYLSDDTTVYVSASGADTRVSIPFKFHAPDGDTSVQVYRNDGTVDAPVWTKLTVKTSYIDKLVDPNDVLFYFQEKVLEQQETWPNLSNAVKIIAKYEVPLRIKLYDSASYSHYGMWFDGTLSNSDYTTRDIAKNAGRVKLAQSSFSAVAISFSTIQPGLRSGQVIHVKNTLHGIDADYMIQKVTATIDINGMGTYAIDVGVYNKTLADVILALAKKSTASPTWNDDEVLDEILNQSEKISVSEIPALSYSSSPYYISNNLEEVAWIGFCAIDPVV